MGNVECEGWGGGGALFLCIGKDVLLPQSIHVLRAQTGHVDGLSDQAFLKKFGLPEPHLNVVKSCQNLVQQTGKY